MSPAWKVDDLNSDLHRLSHLMSAICQIRFDLRVDENDPRVDSLLWIAREMVQGIVEHHDQSGLFFVKGGEA